MKKTVLITGATGFIGTNLTADLLNDGLQVVAIDNFSASERSKKELFRSNPDYDFFEGDINDNDSFKNILEKYEKIDEIYNLACPASPPRYQNLSIETIKTNTYGLFNVLELAKNMNAKCVHTSTSEIYGDPLVHPQNESYRGNVNTTGPRSCYDEGKRISETICYEYKNKFNTDVKIARIFNTYGPFMDPNDGRVVSNFIVQALQGTDITIYGDGSQTRSFQFISDLVNGLKLLMNTESNFLGPVNLGNPVEFTIYELADLLLKKIDTKSTIVYHDLPIDDPKMRKPDITLANTKLNWAPKVPLDEGLEPTIEYFKKLISK